MEASFCMIETIVIGRANSRQVFLTENDSGFFTDYGVRVEKWLRPGNGASSLVLAVRGGTVEIAGTLLEDPQRAQPALQQLYVLFAHPIADDGGSELTNFTSLFQRATTGDKLQFDEASAAYLEDLTAAVSTCPVER